MKWAQPVNPFDNLFLSALIAILPIALIFWALIIKKMKGHRASLLATGTVLLFAIVFYKMPVSLSILSVGHGMLYGLFPICWIFIAVLYLFNLSVSSGQFEIIKYSMASITPDRRLQALLIAFSFGAFLEGTAGFGAPVAISAAMLTGLGFDAFYAAGICLIANTAPVAFGAIGIPITVLSNITGIPEMTLSQMVGRTLPFLSLLLPFYLVLIMSGFRKAMEVWPAILVSGLSFAVLQWFCANHLGPHLPDILSGIGSIICLTILLKYWKPKNTWRHHNEAENTFIAPPKYTPRQIIKAWSSFLILTFFVIIWGLQPIKTQLDKWGMIQFQIPGIHNMITDYEGHPIPHIFKFNYLSAAGTAILLSSLITIPLSGLRWTTGFQILLRTIKQLKYPIITVVSILGFAYIINDSGISITIAHALSETGILYPFFAPLLGWLGVFITGSDTSSNALFGKLQYATATSIGVDPTVTVAANSTGGVVGKMISPQSIAIATASVGLIGKESRLFRFTVKHSIILLSLICLMTVAQAYWIKGMIPKVPPTTIVQQSNANK